MGQFSADRLWRTWPALLILLMGAVGISCGGDDDDGPMGPGNFPDARGTWRGTYSVSNCVVEGAGQSFCSEIFEEGVRLPVNLGLDQSLSSLSGVLEQGQLVGSVEGEIDMSGTITLSGSTQADAATATILEWETVLVGDTLLGGWRFHVESADEDVTDATVTASLRLFGEGVPTLFGCPAVVELTPGDTVESDLDLGDCQFPFDGSLFDPYILVVEAGDSLAVTLRSDSLDAFLLMYREETDPDPLSDDNSGGGTNESDARIEHRFEEPDTFFVLANSATPGESGPYVLSIEDLSNGASSSLTKAGATGGRLSDKIAGSLQSEIAALFFRGRGER